MTTAIKCDPNEAPAGFTAVLKSHLPQDKGNLCQFCDWRKTCQNPATDFAAPGHRCMSYPVTTPEGKTIARKDGAGVVFKLAPFVLTA